MISVTCEQGSPEWHRARLGLITASRVKDALARTSKGWGASRDRYRAQLAYELATGMPGALDMQTAAMRRGTLLEPMALACYERVSGSFVDRAGLLIRDDHLLGYSPDGLIGNDGLVEVKCPGAEQLVACITDDPAGPKAAWQDYRLQMLAGLLVTGRDWCDLAVYSDCENGEELLWTHRIHRDYAELEDLKASLVEFRAEVHDLAANIQKFRV